MIIGIIIGIAVTLIVMLIVGIYLNIMNSIKQLQTGLVYLVKREMELEKDENDYLQEQDIKKKIINNVGIN